MGGYGNSIAVTFFAPPFCNAHRLHTTQNTELHLSCNFVREAQLSQRDPVTAAWVSFVQI